MKLRNIKYIIWEKNVILTMSYDKDEKTQV